MKKRFMRLTSLVLTVTMMLGSTGTVFATETVEGTDASVVTEEVNAISEEIATEVASEETQQASQEENVAGTDTAADENEVLIEDVAPENAVKEETSVEETPTEVPTGENTEKATEATTETESGTGTVAGTITLENIEVPEEVEVEVEEDANDDNVEIKAEDKPYLALGADLSAEQLAKVLSLLGVDGTQLANYNVVYVNNAEEHQYLGSYIDSSKIGTRSLSSIIIVEREEGNGINISTNNISYCTVGMYKNALATAGIQNADIIVAGPTAISGTAALVGIFKAYKEMTGKEIAKENVDAALNELVVTGALQASSGAEADEIEGMIAYVKQMVVERDLTNANDIRDAIEEACKEFNVTLTEEDIQELVNLMLKISELDLDLEGLLNAAQSIYDKIKTADSGFWAKIGDLLDAIVEAIKNIFS